MRLGDIAIWATELVLSAGGLRVAWWLYTDAWPERYVRVRAPETLDVPLTLDTDWRGLVL